MSESDTNETDALIEEIITELGLRNNKPTVSKFQKYIDKVGLEKQDILNLYNEDKEKEDYANDFMKEMGLKGKNTRIEIMKIIDMVGYSREKIKTAYLRATITERIHHD